MATHGLLAISAILKKAHATCLRWCGQRLVAQSGGIGALIVLLVVPAVVVAATPSTAHLRVLQLTVHPIV